MINTTNEGSKLYLYSITSVAILGGLLFGYDTAVISGAEKGLEAFFLSASDFQYNKVMHGITSSSALIGCVLGGAISGIFASRLGRRNSLRLAAVLFFLSALGSYYPEVLFFEYGKPNMDLLIAFNLYRVLGGIGVGLASAVCPMYIAEIAPSNIRGTLVSCNQFAIIFGMLVVYFVNFLIMGDHQNPVILKDAAGVLSVSSESDMWTVYEGWRYMFGSEAFPAAFFGLLLFFVPKTPRYLVLIQQDEKAYSILEKINGKTKAQEILNDIKATAHEKTEKIFTYGVAVIVIGILLSVFQQAIGINAVLYYAPRIFENTRSIIKYRINTDSLLEYRKQNTDHNYCHSISKDFLCLFMSSSFNIIKNFLCFCLTIDLFKDRISLFILLYQYKITRSLGNKEQ